MNIYICVRVSNVCYDVFIHIFNSALSSFLFIFNNHFRYALILLKTKGKIIQRHFLYSYLFCSFCLRFFPIPSGLVYVPFCCFPYVFLLLLHLLLQ